MKKQNEQFEQNIARLVKSTSESQIPSDQFTNNLIDQAIGELEADQPRRQRSTFMTFKIKSLLMISACAVIACIVLLSMITASFDSTRQYAKHLFNNLVNRQPDSQEVLLVTYDSPSETPHTTEKEQLAPIPLSLPKPMFVGTPTNFGHVDNLEKPLGKPRPPFYAPVGTCNVALNKPVTSSEEIPIIGDLEMIVDGNKEAPESNVVELGPYVQWIQIDLEQTHNIYAIVFWHYHRNISVYYDVVVQVSDDPDFINNVTTLFNNDIDNSLDFGVGTDKHYFETAEGKLVDAKGMKARYVRLYSQANIHNDYSHYIEVEVYGKPVE